MLSFESIDKYIYDVEIYPNYFCIVLKCLNREGFYLIDTYNFLDKKDQLYKIIKKYILISYGGHDFDDLVLDYLYSLKDKKKIKIKEIHNKIRRLNHTKIDKKNREISSLDILKEFNCNVGIKGFTFNLGEDINENRKEFYKFISKKESKRVIDYCINDVVQTEKLYKMLIQNNEDIWFEKELLSKALSNKLKLFDFYKNKKCLAYTNEELACLLLLKNKSEKENLKKLSSIKQIDKFLNIKNKYSNRRKTKVFMIDLEEDYFYKILLYLENNNNLYLKKINLKSFDFLIEKYKKNLYKYLTDNKNILFDEKEAKYIVKLRNIILGKIKKLCRKFKGEFLKVKNNRIFIYKITENRVKKLKLEIEKYFNNIFKVDIKEVDKFIRLNENSQAVYAIVAEEHIEDNFFQVNYFINPSQNKWLAEVLKLYYIEKINIEEAVNKLFKENPNILFMYYMAHIRANKCDRNGFLLDEKCLEREKKYRVYYSKTGDFKIIDRKYFQNKDENNLKYNKRFGIGNINSSYFKMKYIEKNIENFSDYSDLDLKSYIFYAKNFIRENK